MALNQVVVFALGGLGEIGKNMYVIEYNDEIIVIDAGLKFAENDMPGVDLIIPDVSYLVANQHKVKGLFLTHGHEDHIGALPYVLRKLRVPVYGAPLTIGLVRAKLEEHRLHMDSNLIVINEKDEIAFDHLKVSFYATTHSIPDALGVVVDTPEGTIVHTGDFKFDFTPTGEGANLGRMGELGNRGVLALLSDSTNAEKPGFAPSERMVGEAIRKQFVQCPGRILFATFASNVDRLQHVVDAAWHSGRKLAVIGRSMEKVFRIGQELGHIRLPDKDMLIDVDKLDKLRDDQVAIICTGSQGETMAALTRIAFGSHNKISIRPGDTVIFSSSPIPGNTVQVYRSIDQLFRVGADVIYSAIFDIHTSGHGYREDLKLMLSLMKPKYFIPIHGEYRMQLHHAKLAEEVGVEPHNIEILDMGQTVYMTKDQITRGPNRESGSVYIHGTTTSNLKGGIMEERRLLSEEGVLVVVTAVDADRGKIISGPDIVSRGFVYMRDSEGIIQETTKLARKIILDSLQTPGIDPNRLREKLEGQLQRFIVQKIKREPMIISTVEFLTTS